MKPPAWQRARPLGRSGLWVPPIALGTMTFGGVGLFSALGAAQDAEAAEFVARCLDAGANLFDTADFYSGGEAEAMLGRALGSRRDEALIATKVFLRTEPGPNGAGLSRHHIVRSCEASLRRLGTDWIDLYQAHGFDPWTPVEETLAAFDDLVRSGKVRYLGCSNFAAWQLMKSQAVAEQRGTAHYVAHQIYYNLVGRDIEVEIEPACRDQGVGLLVWSPLAGGFLSGKYTRHGDAPPDSRRSRWVDEVEKFDLDLGYAVVDVLRDIARDHGASPSQVALNWLLAKPSVSSVIIGARTLAQLDDNLAVLEWSLNEAEVARLDAASAVAVPYPQWHHGMYRADRLEQG
ncbi:MAG: hypothetical protein QOG80_1227 [Pseudonocardiales bacterium]|jgi:aryl-alcohol dehydrogenase-like predicted oxidoreductase|nr:hypothetical protein [Pseudonocardiales bacterium]